MKQSQDHKIPLHIFNFSAPKTYKGARTLRTHTHTNMMMMMMMTTNCRSSRSCRRRLASSSSSTTTLSLMMMMMMMMLFFLTPALLLHAAGRLFFGGAAAVHAAAVHHHAGRHRRRLPFFSQQCTTRRSKISSAASSSSAAWTRRLNTRQRIIMQLEQSPSSPPPPLQERTEESSLSSSSSTTSTSRLFSSLACSFVSSLPRGGGGGGGGGEDDSATAASASSEESSEQPSTFLEEQRTTQIFDDDDEPARSTGDLGETEQTADTTDKRRGTEAEQSVDTIQKWNTTSTTANPSSSTIMNGQQNVTISCIKNSNNNTIPTTTSTLQSMPMWKQTLPPILQKKKKNLVKINWRPPTTTNDYYYDNDDDNIVEIYLLGTAHVSNDSSADVRALLQAVQPHCIFVELCEARIPLLTASMSPSSSQHDREEEEEEETIEKTKANAASSNTSTTTTTTSTISFWDRWHGIQQSQGGSKLQALTSMLLTSVQEDYAETLGVELGGEFRAAHEYWQQQHQQHQAMVPTQGPPFLVLGDRPVQLTMLRAWESLWWWPKTKVLLGLLWSSLIYKPKADEIRAWLQSVLEEQDDGNKDLLTESMAELRQHFPSLYTTIIEERDCWLAAKLVQTCRAISQLPLSTTMTSNTLRRSQQEKRKRPIVVAIVGAGHVPGICAWMTIAAPPLTLLPAAGAAPAPATAAAAAMSPEEILLNLAQTKRWAKDEMVQKELIPQWVEQVTQLQDNQDWMWAAAAAATTPSVSSTTTD